MGDMIGTIGTTVGIVTGSVGILSGIRHLYRQSIGRRRVLGRKLLRLAPGMQTEYFEQILGAPAFKQLGNDEALDLTWVEPEAYIRAISSGGNITLLSITTRTARFSPTFYKGNVISQDGASLAIKLGKTTFGELPGHPTGIFGFLAARRWGYCEIHYFGNPGLYQTFAYGISDAGYTKRGDPPILKVLHKSPSPIEIGSAAEHSSDEHLDPHEFIQDPNLAKARNSSAINTLTVSLLSTYDDKGYWLGADADVVRTHNQMQSAAGNAGSRLLRRIRDHAG